MYSPRNIMLQVSYTSQHGWSHHHQKKLCEPEKLPAWAVIPPLEEVEKLCEPEELPAWVVIPPPEEVEKLCEPEELPAWAVIPPPEEVEKLCELPIVEEQPAARAVGD